MARSRGRLVTTSALAVLAACAVATDRLLRTWPAFAPAPRWGTGGAGSSARRMGAGSMPLVRMRASATSESAPTKKRALEELEVGQTLTVKVVGPVSSTGLRVSVNGGLRGLLEAGELRDGFPVDGYDNMDKGKELQVRVLDKQGDKLAVTARSGSLDRPPRASGKRSVDGSPFKGTPADQWFEGTVDAIVFFGVFVLLEPPSGGEPVSMLLHKDDFGPGFVDSVIRGAKVRVRVKSFDATTKKASLTMQEP